MTEWNVLQYLKYEKERTRPAVDLADRIRWANISKAVDIGCGPATSTVLLRDRFPKARLLGVDFSENMLKKARETLPDAEFLALDISSENWGLEKDYDLVFSNACIQWVPDHPKLLRRMMELLRKDGILAVQVPLSRDQPVHQLIAELTQSKKWRDRFPGTRVFYTLSVDEYYDLLAGLSVEFEIWSTTYCHRMKSYEDIIEWMKGTGLRPYLSVLSSEEEKEFLADMLAGVKKRYSVQRNGEILFRFPRLFFTAKK